MDQIQLYPWISSAARQNPTHLNVCAQLLEDFIDLILETTTQHFIRLIQDEHLDPFRSYDIYKKKKGLLNKSCKKIKKINQSIHQYISASYWTEIWSVKLKSFSMTCQSRKMEYHHFILNPTRRSFVYLKAAERPTYRGTSYSACRTHAPESLRQCVELPLEVSASRCAHWCPQYRRGMMHPCSRPRPRWPSESVQGHKQNRMKVMTLEVEITTVVRFMNRSLPQHIYQNAQLRVIALHWLSEAEQT